MADKKDLPASGDLLLPCGQTNTTATTNCSRTLSSSNFNPLLAAAAGFNPMAAGYPAGTMAAFYSSPFSMLPYAAAAAAAAAATSNVTNSTPFMNLHGQANVLSPAFPHTANPMWPGLVAPDYMLNMAALQNLHQQQPIMMPTLIDGSGETFSEVLKKMPKPPAVNSNAESANSHRTSGSAGSSSRERTVASNQQATMEKSQQAESSISKSSSSSSSSFSATSLTTSDQKPPSQSVRPSVICAERRSSSSTSHNRNSLVTLAEVATSIQTSERAESKSSKDSKSSELDVKSGHQKESGSALPNGVSALDFSRKRQSSQMNGEERRKVPKLELDTAAVSMKQSDSKSRQEDTIKKDEKSDRQQSTRPRGSSSNDHPSATLFGSSLSSDLKMDPNLLNASAMAWAAISNQWLFANVRNEILTRVAAVVAPKQQEDATSGSGHSRQRSSSKSAVNAGSSSTSASASMILAAAASRSREHQKNEGSSCASGKDAVDVTIDAVIKQQQGKETVAAASTSVGVSGRRHRKSRTSGRSRWGRGSRGGMTVREQLAAKRGNQVTGDQGDAAENGYNSLTSTATASPVESGKTSWDESAALDLSVKGNTTVTSEVPRSSGVSANGVPSLHTVEDRSRVEQDRDTDTSVSKRRPVADADRVRMPLTKGWRRQTYIRGVSSNCVRGDVIYYTPCGKRLGSYSEVIRYLNKQNIRDMDRNNFSFSSKILVGEFLHVKADGTKNGIVKLTEKEVLDLMAKRHSPASRRVETPSENSNDSQSDGVHNSMRSGRTGSGGLRRRPYNVQSRLVTSRLPAGRRGDAPYTQQMAMEQTRQTWDTKRLERERHSQLNEDRRRKLDFMRNQKVMEALQRAKDKEMRQQQLESLKKQEREKAHQQLLFARVLEARRRQEEKERLYAEKLIRREERLAARTATLMKLRQMRQPVEDMELEETKALPVFNRIEHMQLDGQAFADLLMVMEFINNFGHVLKVDRSEIPNIEDVHAGLLHDRRGVKALRSLVKTLLLLVLEYPGLPGGSGGKTLLGQPAKDVGVTDMNMSELLRMFLLSRDQQGKEFGNEMSTQPFEALPPDRKVAILAYMCNELLYCRNVVREIEGNIEVIAKFKSDRWALEGKIRHMKVVRASKRKEKNEDSMEKKNETDTDSATAGVAMGKEQGTTSKDSQEEEDDEEGDSSDSCEGKVDAVSQASNSASPKAPKVLFGISLEEIETISKEERLMSTEEVDKELERLNKEMYDLRSRVNEVSSRVRASPFGQDRYNRYFWILPHYSGIYMEGVESGGVNNPAVKLAAPIGQASPTASTNRSKQLDPVRLCVQDLVEAVSRAIAKEQQDQVGIVYEAMKSEKSTGSVQLEDIDAETLKLNMSTKPGTMKTQGNRKMKPITSEMQRGWWIINQPEQLNSISPCLHHRGIREKQLNRVLTKHGDSIKRVAFQTGKSEMKFSSVRVPTESKPTTITLRNARRLLNMTRQLEEKVFQANVHVRGWKAGDVSVDGSPSPAGDGASSSDSSCDSTLDSADKYIRHNTDQLLAVVKDRLLKLESNIERRYFMPAFNRDISKLCPTVNSTSTTTDKARQDAVNEDQKSDGESSRLSQSASRHSASDQGGAEDEEEDIPLALERWRSGVGKASSIAQLSMCLEELDAQVAWEKSVMKAACQICRGGDDESQLLLCDGCDLAYHTYCFKPKLDSVPDGDWFCPECIAKATRRPCCLLCCRQASRPMITCSECSKNFHLDCLLGPVKKNRNGAWICNGCCANKGQTKPSRASFEDNQRNSSTTSACTSDSPQGRKKPGKKSGTSARTSPRSATSSGAISTASSASGTLNCHEVCSILLAELDAHKDSGPFRQPVDTKVCPLYKKVIKQPMDLSAIQSKLNSGKYETVAQFVADVKLILDNCRTFNEDDSPIGKSGHALRRFFNRRLKELKEPAGKKQQ